MLRAGDADAGAERDAGVTQHLFIQWTLTAGLTGVLALGVSFLYIFINNEAPEPDTTAGRVIDALMNVASVGIGVAVLDTIAILYWLIWR